MRFINSDLRIRHAAPLPAEPPSLDTLLTGVRYVQQNKALLGGTVALGARQGLNGSVADRGGYALDV